MALVEQVQLSLVRVVQDAGSGQRVTCLSVDWRAAVVHYRGGRPQSAYNALLVTGRGVHGAHKVRTSTQMVLQTTPREQCPTVIVDLGLEVVFLLLLQVFDDSSSPAPLLLLHTLGDEPVRGQLLLLSAIAV